MPRLRHASEHQRRACFEQFEQRLVMSGQAVASLLPEMELAAPAITQQIVQTYQVSQNSTNQTSPTTVAANLAGQYGFDGKGQTVAVIDSGIAWDHNALGGGFGAGSKVVGGWDFANNDSNPTDSGSAGMHGTHVSGIIASEHERFKGVSSGVDLVGLRVFNDQGEGRLEWVQQALKWVHENRNNFENPISTVVMSLGTAWNGFTKPAWATLETEFARLREAGIFISVAAGNSFQDYNTPGLSYPAVSEHVVPVSSHDSSGNVSDFSQRSSRVLMAPGESIISTVPNHLFVDGRTDRFMALTGTSMAAPYIAGVSAIMRQANEFMGRQGVNQDLLYSQLLETATSVFDPATNAHYSRVNIEAALAKVIPDLNDNAAETATSIGTINGGEQIRGTIGKLSDIDYHSFTASQSGTLTLKLTTTHQLDAIVNVLGSQATRNGSEITFSVEAGKEYKFSISSRSGNGHYTFDTTLQSGVPATQWGTVTSNSIANQSIWGESVYRIQASQNGTLGIQTSSGQSAPLRLEIYDSQMRLVNHANGDSANLKHSFEARQGESYFIKAIGYASSVNFQLGNQVALNNGVLTLTGTDYNDTISVDANNGFAVAVNGITYHYQSSAIQSIQVDGRGGDNSMYLNLGSQADTVLADVDRAFVKNQDYSLRSENVSYMSIVGGNGNDSIQLNGSQGNDVFKGNSQFQSIQGNGFSTTAYSFEVTRAVSNGGFDRAEITGTAGDEQFRLNQGKLSMHSSNQVIVAENFGHSKFDGNGGNDRANIFEAAGDQQIDLYGRYVSIRNASSVTDGTGIEKIHVTATTGNAAVRFFDSQVDDTFTVNNSTASMTSSWFGNHAHGFRNLTANATDGGRDVAHINDTQGNDYFVSNGNQAELRSAHSTVVTKGFENVNMISKNGGYDSASLTGSNGADTLVADHRSATLTDSSGSVRRVVGFHNTSVDLREGNDRSFLNGSAGNESLKVSRSDSEFKSSQQKLNLTNSEQTTFRGNGGVDQIVFAELDLLQGLGDRAVAFLGQQQVTAIDFVALEAESVDNAIAEYDLDLVDFQYLLRGNWRAK